MLKSSGLSKNDLCVVIVVIVVMVANRDKRGIATLSRLSCPHWGPLGPMK